MLNSVYHMPLISSQLLHMSNAKKAFLISSLICINDLGSSLKSQSFKFMNTHMSQPE